MWHFRNSQPKNSVRFLSLAEIGCGPGLALGDDHVLERWLEMREGQIGSAVLGKDGALLDLR